jgi:hypothetical protein
MANGPYRPFRTDDVNLNTVQAAVRDFADQLEDARQGVIAYPAETVTRGVQLGDQAIVRYNGQTANLLLPSAMKRGRGKGQVIVICHEGTGTLTVLPSQAIGSAKADVLTSAVTLQPNQVAVVVSDGYNTWFAIAGGAVGPGAATYGPWISTVTLDAQGRITGVGMDTPLTSAKANSGGTPITGALEVDGAGCVTISEAGQIITVTGRDGRRFLSYVHAPGGSGLTNRVTAGVETVTSVAAITGATANLLLAIPFVAPQRGGTATTVDFEVLGGPAVGNGRIGLYDNVADNNLYPKTLLADGGSISLNSVSVKAASISVALTGGALYWLVYNTDNAAVGLNKLNGVDMTAMLGAPAAGGTAYNVAISVAQTFGAMPATFPASGAYVASTATVPRLRLEIS